ncbi:HlyD family efflux transporter periplasmic adaptor subunit [Roseateles sp. P5_E7]
MSAGASVHSIADEQRSRSEAAAWSRFTAPADGSEFYDAWLALLAGRVQRARAALLLLADDGGSSFAVAAAWPDPGRDLKYLGPTAERALVERRGIVEGLTGNSGSAEQGAHVAYPIELGDMLCGAVVVEIGGGGAGELQAALREVHWAIAWLVDHFRARMQHRDQAEAARMALLNGLLAAALQHRRLQPSALAVANELAARLQCDRVSIGFEHAGEVEPLVISHTATFDPRSDLVRHLRGAMEETLDLGVAVLFPAADQGELRALAHAETARELKVDAMLSVPVVDAGQTVGVLTLERNDGPPFDADEQRIARAVGVVLGPAWTLQRVNSRGAWQRVTDALHGARVALFGPRHPGLKLVGGVAAVLLLLVALVRVDHRVAGRTTIEGATQIAAAAPFDGFVAAGLVRAGDTVKKGQPLARLEDRELKLERARWLSESEQLQRRYQVAMAGADRSTMSIHVAQIDQAKAQLALAEDKLARAELTAPFDGIVVSGDLSQLIGTPVEQGKLLFEVAPLENYRVVLRVDDRDIGRLSLGQRGELVLSSLPGRVLPFTVRSITPVSTQEDGRNVFRVEAGLQAGDLARLRPGMEGVGKVSVGEASLLWVWTHSFVDWLRLALWNWMP